jgi:hypothetical protein
MIETSSAHDRHRIQQLIMLLAGINNNATGTSTGAAGAGSAVSSQKLTLLLQRQKASFSVGKWRLLASSLTFMARTGALHVGF